MWGFASNTIAGPCGPKNDSPNTTQASPDCSDDEISINNSQEDGLECPICWESFNIVENVPYVLCCGHTLCKNCVLGLQYAAVKLPILRVRLPFFISCPWCNLLSFRLVYKETLKFPRKNYFLLWMVESLNGDTVKSHYPSHGDHVPVTTWPANRTGNVMGAHIWAVHFNAERTHSCLRKLLIFFAHLMAKFPLVFVFLVVVLYAIPASAFVLAVYVLVTILFAVPSFLVLYFAYPSLDWLVREIIR